MKSHYPLDFSCMYNLYALFTLGREWQKVDGTALSSFLEIWLSLVEISSWTLVKDEQEGSWLSSSVLCLGWNFGLGLFTWAGPSGKVVLIPLFNLGLFSFYHTFGCTKWTLITHIAMGLHPSWTLIISGY